MSKKVLYHGSPNIVDRPQYGKGRINNDYGLGFYCTEHIELAKEWACNEDIDGYANSYELDMTGLSLLDLSDGQYNILNWLAILLHNRRITLSTPVAKSGAEYLINNFLPEYQYYDVIKGYRADDSYHSFARAFVMNTISLKQLSYAMKLGALGEQYVLKSPKAFDSIKYTGYTAADSSSYYPRRKSRDEAARSAFFKELETRDTQGIFLLDIIREELKSDDLRLQ